MRTRPLTGTIGKLANIAPEAGDLDRVAEGVLKQFVAGDRMYFDRKGVPGINAHPTARLILAANNRPRFRDRSLGMWRRMVIVPFRRTIPEADQDPRLSEKLLVELPGILNWAVEGLRRLRERGHLTVPAICRDLVAEYQRESNPARVFFDEHCHKNQRAHVYCKTLYQEYRQWADECGYRPLNAAQLGKEVHRTFPDSSRQKRGTKGRRCWAYVGLRLTKESTIAAQ